MDTDLNTMTREELLTLRARIDTALERLAKEEKKKALEAVKQAAKTHGFTLAELIPLVDGDKPARKAKQPAKYRNPDNPNQTWSGHGRPPGWMKAALETGISLSDLAI
ncbi:H-NS histone family protein [Actibacterium sp. D379-3]